MKLLGLVEHEEIETDDCSVSSDDKSQDFNTGSDTFSNKGKKSSGSQQQDHYALLGLGHLRFLATEDQIRKNRAPQDFFKVFAHLHEKWTLVCCSPIPSLGDDTTPVEEVDKFYNFCKGESREHKRWMERRNAKLQEKAKKAEYLREKRTLVDTMLIRKTQGSRGGKRGEKAEKQRKKGGCRKPLWSVEANVESTCASLDMEQLKKLCDGMDERPWGKEQIEMLRKAIQKYPKGTSRIWEVVSEFIGTSRSVEDILKAMKNVLLQKPDSSKAFDSFLEKCKLAQSIASPLLTRDEISSSTEGSGTASSKSAAQPVSSQTANGKAVADPIPDGALSVLDPDAWT
ncbi:unnamed protein product [Miscanthus lutarioriparius]|uniref:Myb-like domain-containing protein n=1 Tax=Miscanthus lutarioriparius TaxID=422564 RepID=A0A811R2R0_9POAL|nr:unnamed protein product [Miscanthus lutarioriparius]